MRDPRSLETVYEETIQGRGGLAGNRFLNPSFCLLNPPLLSCVRRWPRLGGSRGLAHDLAAPGTTGRMMISERLTRKASPRDIVSA